jgi:hypothetical protein
MREKEIYGFRTGDLVEAVIPKGSTKVRVRAGLRSGKVAILILKLIVLG